MSLSSKNYPKAIVVRLTDEMHEKLQKESEEHDRTMAQTVRRALRLYYELPEEKRS